MILDFWRHQICQMLQKNSQAWCAVPWPTCIVRQWRGWVMRGCAQWDKECQPLGLYPYTFHYASIGKRATWVMNTWLLWECFWVSYWAHIAMFGGYQTLLPHRPNIRPHCLTGWRSFLLLLQLTLSKQVCWYGMGQFYAHENDMRHTTIAMFTTNIYGSVLTHTHTVSYDICTLQGINRCEWWWRPRNSLLPGSFRILCWQPES